MSIYLKKQMAPNDKMSSVCGACLSSNRRLTSLSNFADFVNIWPDIQWDTCHSICWECKALFRKMWMFKHRVVAAQNLLKKQVSLQETIEPQCLSNLAISVLTHTEVTKHEYIKSERHDVDYLDNNFDDPLNEELKYVLIDTDNTIKKELSDEKCTETYPDLQCNIVLPITVSKKVMPHKQSTILKSKEDECIKNPIKFNDHKIITKPKDTFSIVSSLFDGTGRVNKLEFQLMEKEKKYKVKVLSEAEMLRVREQDRNAEKFKKSPYKCDKCIVQYTNEQQYQQHLAKMHSNSEKLFKCNICEVQSEYSDVHKAHFVRHYLIYQCTECDYQKQGVQRMLEHCKSKHSGDKRYKCKLCPHEFSTNRRLQYHRNRDHKKLPPCPQCGKKFLTRGGLKLHLSNHNGITLYKCSVCKKDYKGEGGLRAHMRLHSDATPNENAYCAECNVQFKDTYRYKQHLKMNAKHRPPGESKYKCPHCSKEFHHKTAQTRHIGSVHFNEREFNCHICNKGFIRGDRLRNHIMYDHEGVPKPRDHVCSYCDKAFTSHQVLVSHIRIHTGERPYECNLCQTRFTQRSALRTHIRSVHKEK